MFIRKRFIRETLAGTTLALLASSAWADLGWSVDAGVGHTDNATLVDVDPVSDTLPSIGGAIAFDQQTRRVQASIKGQGNYVHYVDDTYDDDFIGNATASLVFGILPETFLWTIEDNYGQIAINQFAPVTPDNRQNLNDFSTGPDLIIRLGSQSDIVLAGRYGSSRYEDSEQIDSETLQGSLSFRRHVSQTSFWGLVASTSRIEYDSPGSPHYDQPMAYATWQSDGARQSLSIDAGVNRIDTANDSFTNPLVRVGWNRKLSPSWTMDLHLGSEYQNTAQQFVTQRAQLERENEKVGISEVPAANHYGGLEFAFERTRTRFSIGGSYSKLDYVVDNGLNADNWGIQAQFSRRMTPRLQGFLTYRIDDRNYEADSGLDETLQTAELRLDWRAGRATFLTVGYSYSDSDSDSTTNTYAANLVFLTISYRYGTLTESPMAY